MTITRTLLPVAAGLLFAATAAAQMPAMPTPGPNQEILAGTLRDARYRVEHARCPRDVEEAVNTMVRGIPHWRLRRRDDARRAVQYG